MGIELYMVGVIVESICPGPSNSIGGKMWNSPKAA